MKLTPEKHRSSATKRLLVILAPLALCLALALGCEGSPTPLVVPTSTPMPPTSSLAPYPMVAPTLDENIFYADVIA